MNKSASTKKITSTKKTSSGSKKSPKKGALLGAVAGAALGVGGMYAYNKQQAKKNEGNVWGGKWVVTYDGDEITTLTVEDDHNGNLRIEGFPSGEPTTGTYYCTGPCDEDESC